MATRFDTERTETTERARPRIWPWLLLAAAIAIALWWATAANRGVNDTGYNNSTTPYGVTPGTGTTAPAPGTGTGTGLGGVGTPGTGDVGGVGTPSPAPTAPGPGM
jgi:hypothetical protein